MLSATVTIERSPEVVWAYFTEPQNWERWWGGGMKSARWRRGGELVWALGGASQVLDITPGQRVVIRGSWMDTTWTFELAGPGETAVRVGIVPKRGASFTDGGAAQLAEAVVSEAKDVHRRGDAADGVLVSAGSGLSVSKEPPVAAHEHSCVGSRWHSPNRGGAPERVSASSVAARHVGFVCRIRYALDSSACPCGKETPPRLRPISAAHVPVRCRCELGAGVVAAPTGP
jgi:uncharacterized protein YndB with AHSA1/START domain